MRVNGRIEAPSRLRAVPRENLMQRVVAVACLLSLIAVPVARADTGQASPQDAPLQLEWNLRLRHEQVDNAAFARDARADTARLRLGLRANFGAGWSGLLEGNGVASAGNDYNSGANGRTAWPAITDPRGAEISQAWIGWQGGSFGAIAGRQRIVLDNNRWIGDGGWRQHPQTFDAVSMQWQPAVGWTLRYAWLDHVYRSAGRDALDPLARERDLDTHLVNLQFQHGPQQWVGYAYLHEDRDVATASSATVGARWTGKPAGNGFGWALEAAHQTDYANNPQHFSHKYWLVEPAWTWSGLTGKLGWEHLGGDGRTALQTPLATLHSFNGWDDRFTVTPVGGLNDRYAALNGALGRTGMAARMAWIVAWHDFRANNGRRYGSEWDASLGYPLLPGLTGLVKLARYRADGFSADDTKLWLQLEWSGTRALR